MVVLGINISHDSSISIVKDGQHLFSIAEERINRIKVYTGFPFKSLRYIIDNQIIQPEEITDISISSSFFSKKWAFTYAFELTEDRLYYDVLNESKPKNFYINDSDYLSIRDKRSCKAYVGTKLKNIFETFNISAKIHYVDHHFAHACAAYYASGFKKALSITMDGVGDRLSSTVNICENGTVTKVSETDGKNSVGLLYSEVTKMCGFKVARHEGKITGLAAHGDFSAYEDCFDKLLKYKDGKILHNDPITNKVKRVILSILNGKKIGRSRSLLSLCGKLSDKDLAASIQNLVEKVIKRNIEYWINETKIYNVVLGGGVFANVKVNQHVSEIANLKELFIFPNMGDGGNAYGSAAFVYFSKNKHIPLKTKNVYLGPEFSNQYIKKMLDRHKDKVEFYLSKDICKDTAQLLSSNKIIGWFQGRMEYGPRALGNRSIIASPVDSSINQWLNERMERTEFMPFAPSCLYEFADELFEITNEKLKYPAEFMTITFNMKEKWTEMAPAVSHIDKTARPQLVTKEANPKYHNLLRHYYELTGLPLFINTSFNVHEEPIVCLPEEGLKSLLSGVIDYFCIGDFICHLKSSNG